MVMNKRGQIFLLAAVIISVVVLSLGATTNRVLVNSEPEDFYKLSYEVKRESSAVLDYEIYKGDAVDGDMDAFIESLVKSVRGKEPNANFVIIYGNNVTGINITNMGKDSDSKGKISYKGASEVVEHDVKGRKKSLSPAVLEGMTHFTVSIGDKEVGLPISEYNQVIFIMQKEVNDESFISVS